MVKRTVWVVLEEDADPYCGYWLQAIFDSKEKAEKYVKKHYFDWERKYVFIEEWEVK